MADRESIVRRLTPDPGAGNRNLADLLQGLGAAPLAASGRRSAGGGPDPGPAQHGTAPQAEGAAREKGRGARPRGGPPPPGARATGRRVAGRASGVELGTSGDAGDQEDYDLHPGADPEGSD